MVAYRKKELFLLVSKTSQAKKLTVHTFELVRCLLGFKTATKLLHNRLVQTYVSESQLKGSVFTESDCRELTHSFYFVFSAMVKLKRWSSDQEDRVQASVASRQRLNKPPTFGSRVQIRVVMKPIQCRRHRWPATFDKNHKQKFTVHASYDFSENR